MAQSKDSYERFDDACVEETPHPGAEEAQQQAAVPTTATNRREKHKRVFYGLGIAECVLAGLMIILAIATLCLAARPYGGSYSIFGFFTYVSQGLWGGILVGVTGILGVCTKKFPSVCMYNANMAMSIVTASILPVVVILSGFASVFTYYFPIHIVITLLSLAAMIVCIVHSAYCCAGVCCGKTQYQGVVVYVPQQQQQGVRLPNVQYVVPVGNPVLTQQYGYVMATAAPAPSIVGAQPPQAEGYAQQTVLPQGAIAQPADHNSPNAQRA